jgi:hypothetical protein
LALASLEAKQTKQKTTFMQSEEQYLLEQFESLPVELQRQLITMAQHFQQNAEDYKRVIKPENMQPEDKTHALTKGAVCLHVLIALDETKPPEATDVKHISRHIDSIYNQVKKNR